MSTNLPKNLFNIDFSEFTDVEKVMKKFQMPELGNGGALLEAQRKNIEALTAANKVAIEGAQAFAQRQAEIMQQSMDEVGKAVKEMAAGDSPEEKMVKQTELVKEAYEHAFSNLRELAEMGAKSQSEAMAVLNSRFSESMDELKSAIKTTSAKGKGK